ncbi:CocE/NonD family hydrolase [Streptomyces sp. NPDC002680]|uniref:CocE/NonD family hydrolase n=1 Tax=Streptomyces sp. NPDC002680 TaxID=3364659 RepID=UPI0036A407F0
MSTGSSSNFPTATPRRPPKTSIDWRTVSTDAEECSRCSQSQAWSKPRTITGKPAWTGAVIEYEVSSPSAGHAVLTADVYRPAGGGPWPVIVARTPYDVRARSPRVSRC